MKALFDSNVLIYLSQDKIDFEPLAAAYEELFISVISHMEVLGYKFKNETEKTKIKEFLALFHRLDLSDSIVEETIALREKHSIKLPDAIILATAKIHECELVSNNDKDFKNEVSVRTVKLKD